MGFYFTLSQGEPGIGIRGEKGATGQKGDKGDRGHLGLPVSSQVSEFSVCLWARFLFDPVVRFSHSVLIILGIVSLLQYRNVGIIKYQYTTTVREKPSVFYDHTIVEIRPKDPSL